MLKEAEPSDLFRQCWPEGRSDDRFSGHEEGRFLLGANSTASRPCRRRLRVSGKIYLVAPRSGRFNNSGSFAMFAAILRASSLLSAWLPFGG
jgi:hypothetical protein